MTYSRPESNHQDPGNKGGKISFETTVRYITRFVKTGSVCLGVLGILFMLLVAVLINTDIVTRNLLNRPVRGVPELVSLGMVAIAFLGIANAARMDRLNRCSGLLSVLHQKCARGHLIAESAIYMIASAMIARLGHAGLPSLHKAWGDQLYTGSLGYFTIPLWPVKLIVTVSCVVISLQFFALAVHRLFQATRLQNKLR